MDTPLLCIHIKTIGVQSDFPIKLFAIVAVLQLADNINKNIPIEEIVTETPKDAAR